LSEIVTSTVYRVDHLGRTVFRRLIADCCPSAGRLSENAIDDEFAGRKSTFRCDWHRSRTALPRFTQRRQKPQRRTKPDNPYRATYPISEEAV